MLTLCGFKGYRPASVVELRDILAPEATKTWQPLQHGYLAGQIRSRFKNVLNKETYLVSPDQQTLIGSLELIGDSRCGGDPNAAYADTIVFMHDNKKSMSLRLIAGGQVFICSNGMATASWTVRRQHRPGLSDWLNEELDRFNEHFDRQRAQVEIMQRLSMIKPDAALIKLGRRGVLPWRTVGKAAEVYVSPEHHRMHGRDTCWSWYNAVTEAVKGLGAQRQLRAMEKAFKYAAPSLN